METYQRDHGLSKANPYPRSPATSMSSREEQAVTRSRGGSPRGHRPCVVSPSGCRHAKEEPDARDVPAVAMRARRGYWGRLTERSWRAEPVGEIASISPIDGQLITPNRQAMGVVRTGSRAISPGILCSPIVRNPGPWQRVAGPGERRWGQTTGIATISAGYAGLTPDRRPAAILRGRDPCRFLYRCWN